MKESGDEGSDHFPLAPYAGSRNPSLALLACLACSPSPTKPWELSPIYLWVFFNGPRQQVKNGMFPRVANYCWFAFVTSHCGEFIKPLGVSMTPHAQIKKIPDVDLGSSL